MTIRHVLAALVIGAVMVLCGCGGGGGGGGSTGAAPPSNSWDSMVWDQANWG
jgi:hypothetical protein